MIQEHLDEATYCDMMESAVAKMAGGVKRNHSLCHLPIDKERAVADTAYLAAVTLDIFNDANRPMDEQSIQERANLLQSWERKLAVDLASTYDFNTALGRVAGGQSVVSEGEVLKKSRKRNKMTQQDLADHLGTKRERVAEMETGARRLSGTAKKWAGLG